MINLLSNESSRGIMSPQNIAPHLIQLLQHYFLLKFSPYRRLPVNFPFS